MNRKLKFRFWAVKGVIYPHGDTMRYSDNFTSVDLAEGSDWKVMQFTGLKDINGTEIYEGDVVKVERYDDCFGGPNYTTTSLVGAPQWPELLADCSGGPDGNNGVVSIEVIGNIYQNPELTEHP